LQVDGSDAEHVPLAALHAMLRGPLHSTVNLKLARSNTGAEYTVVVLRHGFKAFVDPNSDSVNSWIKTPGTKSSPPPDPSEMPISEMGLGLLNFENWTLLRGLPSWHDTHEPPSVLKEPPSGHHQGASANTQAAVSPTRVLF
jgi:hypothetical protein